MFYKLNTSIKKYTHIVHIADIHILLTKRHEEYEQIFNKLYEEIDNTPETTIICVVGDVVHNKVDLSPECVYIASNFLKNLADRRDVILTIGNHDGIIKNKSRLDSLTPIVDALNHPKLNYLKKSGLYGIGNILFNHMSIYDSADKYILGNLIPNEYKISYDHIIALFHGPVDKTMTGTGFEISNPEIVPELFDWHHLALLGDIHLDQNIPITKEIIVGEKDLKSFNRPYWEIIKKTVDPNTNQVLYLIKKSIQVKIRYCGSLIMQNHGEPRYGHGYTLWNLSDYSYEHREIKNDYGFVTINLVGKDIVSDLSDLPKKSYLRLLCQGSSTLDIKNAESYLLSLTEIEDISIKRDTVPEDEELGKNKTYKNIDLVNISTVEYQESLFKDYLKNILKINKETTINRILEINKESNLEIKVDLFSRNLKWTPIKFEWDNMFSYGEGNSIDFTKLNGVYGIFGPNTCGKSSIFSALCFCLFDKWDRGFKAIVVKNSTKSEFKCKFQFEINNVSYFIEKIGVANKSGSVKVDVNFWKMDGDEKTDLIGTMRKKTNDIIREYIGTFEDFILTTLSIQNVTKNNISFIDLTNAERKDMLVQLIGLNIFDKLSETANEKLKEINNLLKPHANVNYAFKLTELEETLKNIVNGICKLDTFSNELKVKTQELNESIVLETQKLISLDSVVPFFQNILNVDELEQTKVSTTIAIDSKLKIIEKLTNDVSLERKKLMELENQAKEIDSNVLIKEYENLRKLMEKQSKLKNSLDKKNVEIFHKKEKLEKLKKHKYDPNCKFCIENIFVKDANKTKEELQGDLDELNKLQLECNSIDESILNLKWVEVAHNARLNLLNSLNSTKNKVSELESSIRKNETNVLELKFKLNNTIESIKLFHKHKEDIEHNASINNNIFTIKNSLSIENKKIEQISQELLNLHTQKALTESKINSLSETIQTVIKLEENKEIYDLYMKCVGRNGIPHQILCNTIPFIVNEINSILSQMANFTIEMDYDEKNINVYIQYPTRGMWAVEMGSGFERFVASTAIRTALTKISNLPKTNFLIIDEGFSALDSNNIQSMSFLFNFLKSTFDFVFVISHLDTIKDFVDKQIEIIKEEEFSKLVIE
jgi:DNA repair exonuclease SbcCD ATPase subunit